MPKLYSQLSLKIFRNTRILVFMFLVFSSFLSEKSNAQVSLTFSKGYLGTQGANSNQAKTIKNLSTLGISSISFGQSYSGTFGGTQGNDLAGTIKIYLAAGATSAQAVNSVITLNGALNWRETSGSTVEVYGFILDAAASASITLSGQTYNIVGGSNSNSSSTLGLKAYTSAFLFTDGENRSGNAATSGLLTALNAEFANSPQPSAITLTNSSVIEGQNLVFNVALTTAPTVGNPQVLSYSSAGTATTSGDYSSTFTFSNGVTDNGDGTITIPAGVSSFTVTVVTNDDLLSEVTETVLLNIGAKVATGNILDNDSTPTLTTTGALKTFSTCSGCTVSPQSFTVSGDYLTADITINAPSGFQVSTSSSSGFASSVILTQASGIITTTTIYAKLTNNAISANSGVISITSNGASSKTITATANTDNALNFDGVNDIVTIADNNALDVTTNYTIEAWIKPSTFSLLGGIVSKYHTASSNGYILRLTSTGDFSGISFDEMNTSNGVLSLNKWNHIAAVKNGATRKLYINGVEKTLTGTALTTAVNTDPVIIGQDFSSFGSRFFNGSIDEVRIWNTARTATEITNNMNISMSGNETGLVANYNFDQGVANGNNTSITTLTDITANSLAGTISGVTLTGTTSNFVDGFIPEITAPGNATTVYASSTLALSNGLSGGVWSSTNAGIASVNANTGLVSGVATGSVTVTYTICNKSVAYNLNVLLAPTLTSTSLKTFTNCSGCIFVPQSFTVSAANLTSNVVITAPTGFRIATTISGTYTTSISLTPSAGTLSNTSIFVRLLNVASSASSGTLSITSTGVTSQTITLTTNSDNALNLDGTNDIVTVPDNNLLDLTNNYTIEAWIKPTAFTSLAGIVSKNHSANSNGYTLQINGTGKFSGVSFDGMSTKNGVLALNSWNHIAAVNNNGTRKIYVNGLEQVLTGTPLTTAANNDPVIIGQDFSSSGARFFKGSIDEVRIWSTARTVSEITNNLNVSLAGNETGLVANYNFDQGIANGTNTSTTILNDYTTNALNGNITGLALTGNTSNFVDGFMPSITAAGNETEVLVGKTLALTNILTGGVWSSTNTNIATVNSTSGIVTGVATGTATISYAICGKTVSFPLTVTVIAASGTLTTFTSCFGSPSAAQSILVSAVTLTNDLLIKAPDGYELATSVGGTYSTSISLTPISGNVTNTAIYIRLSSKAFNGDHGNIILSSGNFSPKLFPIGLASVKLNVPARVTISSDASGNKICTGTSVNFTASALNGGSTPTYQWKLNGVNVGTNSSTYSTTSLPNNALVNVIMTSSIPSCVTGTPASSNTITTAVYSIPATPTAITGFNTLCLGSTAAYTVNNVAFATSYDWVVSGNISATASTINALNTTASNSSGTASVKVRAVNFCGTSPFTNDYDITISNTPAPTVNFTLSSNDVCISASSINYTNTSLANTTTNSPITLYNWDFGDGSTTANTENANRTYTAAGKYNVILKIQSQDNCLSSITKPVIVYPVSVAGNVTAVDTVICEGTSTTLNLYGYTGSIQWMSSPSGANNWTNIIGETSDVLKTGNLTDNIEYKAEVRSGVCTVATSATVSITVKHPPVVSIFPPTGVGINDTTFNLSYIVNAGNPNAYTVDVFGSGPMPDFVPNINYALRSSPLTIAIPPSVKGKYTFYFIATELPYACYGSGGQPLTFTLGVGQGSDSTAGSTIGLSYATPNVYNVGTAITALTPNVLGGTLSSCSVSPILPAGLTIDQITGIISGTPSAISSQTSYVVTGTISSTTVSATVDITVKEALPFGLKYNSPNVYTLGTAITALTPTSTSGKIVSYTISPVLPAGLTFNTSTGIISGTPSAISTRTSYVVIGTNNVGTVSATVVITVNGIPPAPPVVQNGRFIFGKPPSLPSLMSAFVSPMPTGVVPVWCVLGTQNCSTTVPVTPTSIGKYIYQLRSYDTTTKLYSTTSVNDTLIIAPISPNAIDSTYVLGVTTNPSNIGAQVSGLAGATTSYIYLGVKQVGIPALGNTLGTKKYSVTQTVNGVESDTTNFNVTILDPNAVIHLQKIVDSGAMQSNSTYNYQFKLVVSNLTNTTFTNVILTDNLQNSVPITSEYSVIKNVATGGLITNSSFNGNSDIIVSLPGSTVAPSAKDTAKFVMNLVPKGYSGTLSNVAYVKVSTKWGIINMQSSDLTSLNPTTKSPTKYQVRDLVFNIPEGFSPNNDGVHDYFVIIKPLNYTVDLEVFNRWGNIVFSSNNYNNDWNGKGTGNFAGQDLVDGGYYYSLRAVDDKGKVQVFKGFVIIQR